jgi:hypothetical protein
MALSTAAAKGVLEKLREPFPAELVKKNQNNLDYVSIDGYLNRLLDVLGLNFDFEIEESSVTLLPPEMKTSSGKMQYLAQARGALVIEGRSRAGVGADVSFDPDKALKTAQAEALKKACHQFGIALELWDEDHRKSLDRQRKLIGASAATLKQEVFKIARERLGKDRPSAKDIAGVFGVQPGDLADEETLTGILKGEGLL